jgi:hypothetical protein
MEGRESYEVGLLLNLLITSSNEEGDETGILKHY